MKFTVIAALVASASAAGTIESGKACTKADDCKVTTECCGDLSVPTAAATAGYTKIDTAAKLCFDKTKTKWEKTWSNTNDGTDSPAWLSTTATDGTKYEATFKCMAAAGAKTLSAAAVLAASYYMA